MHQKAFVLNIVVHYTINKSTCIVIFYSNRFFLSRKALRDPPHGITLHKGAVHIVATWEYINFLFTDKLVEDLLKYLPKVGVPDEALFSTVNHDPTFNAPGNFPCEFISLSCDG